MVTIPEQMLYDIKIEMEDSSYEPTLQEYAKDSNTDKIKINNQSQDSVTKSKLQIRDIAKLSRNSLEKQSLLNENSIKNDGLLNYNQVRKLWDQHLSGKSDLTPQIWSILMFQSWLKEIKSSI